jgi:hypothetical protein
MLAGAAAPFTPSPLTSYVVFDLLVGVLVGFQLWALVRVLRTPMQPARAGWVWLVRHMVVPVAWRLALAVAATGLLFVIVGGMLGASPRLMAETDLGVATLALSGLLLVNGVLRGARAYVSRQARHAVVAAASVPPVLQMATR